MLDRIPPSRSDVNGWGPPMRPRESTPFWVWLALGIMAGGSAAYVATYFMVGDLLALIR